MSNEQDDTQYNPAASIEVPTMRPRGAELRGQPQRERQHPRAGAIEDDDRGGDRSMERQRVTGARPVVGIGEPQPMAPEVILNQAHGFLEAYKAGKQIDPVLVHIMTLQALGTFGSHATKISQLTQEVGRLRKLLEERGSTLDAGGGDQPRRGSFKDRILNKRQAAAGGRGGGRTLMRGRGR